MSDTLGLPFDQYQRYRLVADLVNELREDRSLEILDVGGRTGLLRAFLPEDDVHLVDVEPSPETGLVLGDGSRLPFRDGTFDVACGFDTLEHVPAEGRASFVAECARVSRGYVVLSGPYKSPQVDEAEELLVEFLREKLGVQHAYLSEHRTHGLPVRAEVEATLREAGAAVRSFGHANLDRWLALMCLELYLDHDPGLRPLAQRFFRFYNESLYASDHAAPVYRHAVVAARSGRALPSGAGILDAPVAPPGTIKSLTGLVQDVIAFDAEHEVWRPEIARLKDVVGGLERDLAGHKERLSDTRADLVGHRDRLTESERDLAGHRKRLSEAEHELGRHRRALEQADAERERTAREQTEVQAELRAEIAAHERHKVELEEQLARAEEGAQAIEGELDRARVDTRALQAELDACERELANRWSGVKRFFVPGRRPGGPDAG